MKDKDPIVSRSTVSCFNQRSLDSSLIFASTLRLSVIEL